LAPEPVHYGEEKFWDFCMPKKQGNQVKLIFEFWVLTAISV